MEEAQPLFSSNPEILGGTLCIHGTRMPVDHIAAYIDADFTVERIIEDYPDLRPEQIEAVFRYLGKPIPKETP